MHAKYYNIVLNTFHLLQLGFYHVYKVGIMITFYINSFILPFILHVSLYSVHVVHISLSEV